MRWEFVALLVVNTPDGDRRESSIDATGPTTAGVDLVFEALARPRRRRVLRSLSAENPRSVSDLAAAVAEREAALGHPSDDHRRRVEHSLVHVHLPKLEDVNIVARHDGDVAFDERADDALVVLAMAERARSAGED